MLKRNYYTDAILTLVLFPMTLFAFSNSNESISEMEIKDHAVLMSMWKVPLVSKMFFSGSFINLGSDDKKPKIHYISSAHCVANENGRLSAFDPSAYSNRKRLCPFSNFTSFFSGLSHDKFPVDLSQIKLSIPADIFYCKATPEAYENSTIHEISYDLPRKGESLYILGYPGAKGPYKIKGEYHGVTFDYPKKPNDFFTLFHWIRCDPKYVKDGISGSPVLNENGEIVGVVSRYASVPRWKFWKKEKRNRIKGFVGYHQISRDMLTGNPNAPLNPYLEGEHFYEDAFFDKKATPVSASANFHQGYLHGAFTIFENGTPKYRSQFDMGKLVMN